MPVWSWSVAECRGGNVTEYHPVTLYAARMQLEHCRETAPGTLGDYLELRKPETDEDSCGLIERWDAASSPGGMLWRKAG